MSTDDLIKDIIEAAILVGVVIYSIRIAKKLLKHHKYLDKMKDKQANESNLKSSEQKTLEAIRSNTSTIVNILTFYVVITIISLLYLLYTLM